MFQLKKVNKKQIKFINCFKESKIKTLYPKFLIHGDKNQRKMSLIRSGSYVQGGARGECPNLDSL